MDDYIKREDVHDAINWIDDNGVITAEAAHAEIRKIPAADVRENVRGQWQNVVVRTQSDDVMNAIDAVASMQCPKCERWHNEVYLYGSPTEMANYCPNCGARMDGGTKDG